MEGVEFEQDNIDFTMKRNIKQRPTIAATLVKKGIASSERQANIILLGVALVGIVISSLLLMSSFKSGTDEITYDQLPDELIDRLPPAQQQAIRQSN